MSGHCATRSLYHLPGNVISATVGLVLVYINLQPKYKLPNLTRFEQFQKFEKKMSWGNNFCTVSEFLFMAMCALDFTFLAPLTSEI